METGLQRRDIVHLGFDKTRQNKLRSMFDIPTSTNKGLNKLNLTIFLMFSTKGSEGWLIESMSTLKDVLVTMSIL